MRGERREERGERREERGAGRGGRRGGEREGQRKRDRERLIIYTSSSRPRTVVKGHEPGRVHEYCKSIAAARIRKGTDRDVTKLSKNDRESKIRDDYRQS